MNHNRGLTVATRQLVEYAETLGFSMQVARGGHLKFSKSGYSPVFVSRTPSDGRAYKNAQSDLRRTLRAKKCG